jgi:hypothetical protein
MGALCRSPLLQPCSFLGNPGGLLGSYAVGWCVTHFGSYDAGIDFVVAAQVICLLLIPALPGSLAGKARAAEGNRRRSHHLTPPA